MQILQKQIKDGKIFAEKKPHPQNKQPCYMIPVSEPSPLFKGNNNKSYTKWLYFGIYSA